MFPHDVRFKAALSIFVTSFAVTAQSHKAPVGGYPAIVVDDRLAVLRTVPQFDGHFVRRLPRGKLVAVKRVTRTREGESFTLINVSRRTHGWILSDALVSPRRLHDDERLLNLIKASTDFERVARARILLDYFPNSQYRAAVLLLLGELAEQLAVKLSRDAAKKLDGVDGPAYYSNYAGLDRYSRKGIWFVLDPLTRSFHYDGAAFRELIRRYPHSTEASEARKHLEPSSSSSK